MCRNLVSVDHEGRIYDCDFNQQLDLQASDRAGQPLSIYDFDVPRTLARRTRFAKHCLACTAAAGSSCGGATAWMGAAHASAVCRPRTQQGRRSAPAVGNS